MPNWTENKLHFVGSPVLVSSIIAIIGDKMDFEKIIPLKDGIDPSDAWGTKWNACEPQKVSVSVICGLMTATYEFKTAWDTPREVIKKLISDWGEDTVEGGYVHEGYEGCGSFHDLINN
ncbi:MAG: hypothetical protein VW714_08315 [Rhodospirillales bacterium]